MEKIETMSSNCAKRREMRGVYAALAKLLMASERFRASRGHGYGRAYSYYIRNS